MSTVVRQFVGALLRSPRLSLICAALLVFGVARHFLGVRLDAMMSEWDWRSRAALACSADAPCPVIWDATAPGVDSSPPPEGPP